MKIEEQTKNNKLNKLNKKEEKAMVSQTPSESILLG
jgi:hypothetical protein